MSCYFMAHPHASFPSLIYRDDETSSPFKVYLIHTVSYSYMQENILVIFYNFPITFIAIVVVV